MHNTPGKAVTIHPGCGRALAAFMVPSPAVPGYDYRDTDQHKRLLAAAFADSSWRVPELLDRVHAADDLYFDSVSRVRLPQWWHGRVALVGDAASCVSLLGGGSSLAMIGAFTLADELAASPSDHLSAFRRYQAKHRTLVDPRLRTVGLAVSLLVPARGPGIVARNLATRLWPLAAAAGWLGRRLAPSRERAETRRIGRPGESRADTAGPATRDHATTVTTGTPSGRGASGAAAAQHETVSVGVGSGHDKCSSTQRDSRRRRSLS